MSIRYLSGINVDANTLFVDSANDRVGIGTASPSVKLHVSGGDGIINTAFIGQVPLYGANFAQFSHTSRSGADQYSFLSGNAGDTYVNSANSESIFFRNNNNNTLAIITSAGNVGIGTTSPSAPLHVYKSDTYSAIISRADWNSGTPTKLALGKQYGVLGFISSDLVETTNDTSYIALNYKSGLTTYAEGLRVYNNGNVGIGTTAPGARLEVVAGNTTSISVRSGNSGQYSILSVGRTSSDIIIASAASSGQFWTGSVAGDGWVGSTNGTLSLGNDTTGVANLTIKSGNVGIGTTSPSSPFTVATDVRAASLNAADLRPQSQVNLLGGGGDSLFIGQLTNSTVYMQSSYFNATLATYPIALNPLGGNVGIGTTAPIAKLQVEGSGIVINTENVYDAKFLYFRYSNGGDVRADSFLTFSTGGSPTEKMRIADGGNVGIGTTAPVAKLHITGANNDTYGQLRVESTGAGADAQITFGTPLNGRGIYVDDSDSNKLKFYTGYGKGSSGREVTFDNEGNVGIGTTAPAANAKLTIDGSAGANTSQIDMVGFSSTAKGHLGQFADSIYLSTNYYYSGGQYNDTATLGQAAIVLSAGATSTSFIDFNLSDAGANSPSNKVRITSSGNVGIGTTSPAYKLDVNGNIRSFDGIRNEASHSTTNYENILPAVNNGAGTGIAQMAWWVSEPGVTWEWGGFGYNVINDGGAPYGFSRRNTSFGQAYMRMSTLGDWYFYNTNTSGTRVTTMTLTSAGNVGIGTTAPVVKLHVADSGGGRLILQGVGGSGINWQLNSYTDGNLYIGNYGVADYVTLTSAGNVGIGTTAPAYKLEVAGNVSFQNGKIFTISNASGNSLEIYHDAGDGANAWRHIYGGTGTGYGVGVGGYGIYYDGNSNYNQINLPNGNVSFPLNVGIGTTAPTAKLDVAGGGVSTDFRISRSVDPTAYFSINAPGGSPNASTIGINGVDVMTLRVDGNVGIGTTSPGQKLQVDGNIYVNDDGTTGNGIMLRGADRPLIARGWDPFTSGNKTGVGRWGVYMESAELFIGAPGTDYSNALITLGGWLLNGTRQPNLTLNNSTQRVGIGTTAPATKLHINGGSDYNTTFSSDSFRSGWVITSPGTSTIRGSALVLSSDNSFRFGTALYYHISMNVDGSTQIFNTSGSVATTFSSAGNVGIGTTSPNATLEVDGSFNVKNGNGNVTHFNYIDGSTNYVRGVTYFDTNSAYFTGGNVGIGTTAPTANLTIGANTVVQSTNGIALGIGQASLEFVHATFNNGFGSKFYSVDSGGGVTSLRLAVRADSTTWVDAMTVIAGTTGGGNVGIGITEPAKKLHVSGGSGNVDNLVLESGYVSAGVGVAMQFNRSSGVLARIRGIEEGSWNGGLLFEVRSGSTYPGYDGATDVAMKIATNGNVGIGTTAPGNLLHVAGQPRFDSVGGAPVDTSAPVTQDKYYGTNSVVLTSPDTWLKVSINGTDYVIPAYAG